MRHHFGYSCRKIASNLNNDMVPTPSQYATSHGIKVSKYSIVWSDSRIREIIQNEVYIGNMVQGRMRKINYKSKKNIRLPKEEWKIVKNTHDPIIELNVFQKANEMLALRKHTRIKSHDYLLKGLVYCHECRKKMNCSSRHLACGTRYYFRCFTYLSNSNVHCIPHSFRMDLLEDLIITLVKKLIAEFHDTNTFEKTFHKIYSKYFITNNSDQTIKKYKYTLTTLNFEIDKLYDDKLRGNIDDTDFKRIYTEKKKVQNNIIEKISSYSTYNYSNSENILKSLEDKFFNYLDINKKILTDFIEKIEIDSTKEIYVYLKFQAI